MSHNTISIVFGGSSMIGTELCDFLSLQDNKFFKSPADLINQEEVISEFQNNIFHGYKYNIYMLAGYNGGISFNREYPADIYYKTVMMNMNILQQCCAYRENINKVVTVLASCSYPDFGETVLEEDMIEQGLPNETVECHGLAKRTILQYSRQLYKQYGMKIVNTILTNCYGPGDRFDVNRTKVVGAVVKKICDAKFNDLKSVTFFGTGKPKREIMFCRDAAQALYDIGQTYDDFPNPVNIASDQEISIRDLVSKVCSIVGYDGDIVWNTLYPDGQMRKKLSTEKMKKYINTNITPLEIGLTETIRYYMNIGRFLDK